MRVSGPAYSLHKEAQVFGGGDADEWRPDRWLEAGEEKGKEMRRWMWQFVGGGRGCLGQHFATLRKYRSHSCGLFTPISGNTQPRNRIADGQFDAITEIKAVVAAIYVSFGTILVDEDDGAIEQQEGFLAPPKSGKLSVKLIHL